ncbi:MAG: DNA polymerase IV [Nitrososphaerales archaeon]
MSRVILHIDMDSFYASAEKAAHPEYKDLPLVVGADPREGQGRGVVVAASYEARKYGVKSGIPISRAYKLCPECKYIRPNFPLYNRVSRRVMNILRDFVEKFEQASIDEAYADVSGIVDYNGVQQFANRIREEIRTREGLTCSIGVAQNKSIAKIASDIHKPDGLTIVLPEESKSFLAPLPVRSISGVGKKTEEALKELGIETIGHLAEIPGQDLVKIFGRNGVWIWGIANAEERSEVVERDEIKSISHEYTFAEDASDPSVVRNEIDQLSHMVHKRLVRNSMAFRTVGIKVRFDNFATFTREKSLADHIEKADVIAAEANSLFDEFQDMGKKKIRLIGVRLSNLKEEKERQETLKTWTA